jgi:hypothetical protein
MLRALVLLLMLLNLGYWAWGEGWLLPYGIGPATQREPQRLARQIHPEAIRILRAEEVARPLPDGMPGKAECLQSEVLDAAQAAKLRGVLPSALPTQSWVFDEVMMPERWIVYMGTYANAAEVDKKRSELARLGVKAEAPRNQTLALGLALGGFETQTQADAALKVLSERGVRTARVVQDLATQPVFRLRLPAVDDALKAQLPAVRALLPAQALQPCASVSAPG